jgi:hypothetical protein
MENSTLSITAKNSSTYCETEEELIENARMHGIQVHGYTDEDWEKEIASNFEHFGKHIKLPNLISKSSNITYIIF